MDLRILFSGDHTAATNYFRNRRTPIRGARLSSRMLEWIALWAPDRDTPLKGGNTVVVKVGSDFGPDQWIELIISDSEAFQIEQIIKRVRFLEELADETQLALYSMLPETVREAVTP